jgi:hypothetical protein
LAGSAKENFVETLLAASLLPARRTPAYAAEVEKLEPQSSPRKSAKVAKKTSVIR